MCKLEWKRALMTMASTTGAVVNMPAFEPQKDIIFEYSPRHKLAQTLLTARNEVKIYSSAIHLVQILVVS